MGPAAADRVKTFLNEHAAMRGIDQNKNGYMTSPVLRARACTVKRRTMSKKSYEKANFTSPKSLAEGHSHDSDQDRTFGLKDGQVVFLIIFVLWLFFASAIADFDVLLNPFRQ